jgi:putative acetyltransferase
LKYNGRQEKPRHDQQALGESSFTPAAQDPLLFGESALQFANPTGNNLIARPIQPYLPENMMKIQQLTSENRPKVYALLQRAFPGSDYETELVRNLHDNGKTVHEWVCIHTSKAIAYIAFSLAYQGKEICGLHLAPMAVAPDFQRQGVGTELLRFALRQEAINSQTLFVLGKPGYFQRFGFAPCSRPLCPFDISNTQFLSMRNAFVTSFIVGYEPEFGTAAIKLRPQMKKRRGR